MASLYVTEQGARIEKEHERLLVTKQDQVLLEVPVRRVTDIVLLGHIGLTTPAMSFLLGKGISTIFMSQHGRIKGRLQPPTPKNLPLRHLQYSLADDAAFRLRLARSIVQGKLHNYRALALRWTRGSPSPQRASAARQLAVYRRRAGEAGSLEELRGIEGAGSRLYFQVLRARLSPSVPFERRRRRPPPDPANAALSLGYSLLVENLFAALEVVGLDPFDGFFHADAYGRPALALDLVEEFRGIVVDSVVQTAFNKGILRQRDFRAVDGGVHLTPGGLRRFLRQYAARLNTKVVHPHVGRRLTYQQSFEVQARLLVRAMKGDIPEYLPFVTR